MQSINYSKLRITFLREAYFKKIRTNFYAAYYKSQKLILKNASFKIGFFFFNPQWQTFKRLPRKPSKRCHGAYGCRFGHLCWTQQCRNKWDLSISYISPFYMPLKSMHIWQIGFESFFFKGQDLTISRANGHHNLVIFLSANCGKKNVMGGGVNEIISPRALHKFKSDPGKEFDRTFSKDVVSARLRGGLPMKSQDFFTYIKFPFSTTPSKC